jgi:ABC-type antimicrobial peptide transport system permease subunit
MGASLAAILTRMVRTAMLEELGQDYIRTARAKGLSETAVVCRHALPNALVPIVTVVGLQFGALLAGAIVTETIFSWPGLGRLTVSAISNRDYALVQGCLLSIGLTYVLVNLLTDVVYRWVNPRMRSNAVTNRARSAAHAEDRWMDQIRRHRIASSTSGRMPTSEALPAASAAANTPLAWCETYT